MYDDSSLSSREWHINLVLKLLFQNSKKCKWNKPFALPHLLGRPCPSPSQLTVQLSRCILKCVPLSTPLWVVHCCFALKMLPTYLNTNSFRAIKAHIYLQQWYVCDLAQDASKLLLLLTIKKRKERVVGRTMSFTWNNEKAFSTWPLILGL